MSSSASAKLCNTLWSYIRNYSPDGPKPQYKPEIILKLLERSKEALKKDAMIVKVNGPVVLFGPLYGEGDSMITLMSMAKVMPPDVTYVFLGCYIGNGFAQLECLFYVLSLKLLHPEKVVLLKGHHEESVSMELLKLKDWLYTRGVTQTVHIEEIIVEMKRAGNFMSAGSILNDKILCIPGGPGPCLRERGLKALAALKKGMQEVPDKKIIMEAAWSVLILNEAQKDMHGMPFFTPVRLPSPLPRLIPNYFSHKPPISARNTTSSAWFEDDRWSTTGFWTSRKRSSRSSRPSRISTTSAITQLQSLLLRTR